MDTTALAIKHWNIIAEHIRAGNNARLPLKQAFDEIIKEAITSNRDAYRLKLEKPSSYISKMVLDLGFSCKDHAQIINWLIDNDMIVTHRN